MKHRIGRFLSLLTAAACTITPMQARVFAEQDTEEPEIKTSGSLRYQTERDGSAVYIVGYTEDVPAKLTIPEQIEGIPVRWIGQYAFGQCTALTEVTLPDTITELGFQNFYGCTNLKTVHLPQHLTALYEAAFAECTSLTAIELPDTLESLGNLVFSGCTALKDITFPASLREFGEPALDDTQWMQDQQALNPYVSINGILINTQLVSGEAKVPAGTKEIGPYAFCANDSITSVTIPDGVTALRRCAFDGCTNLKTVKIPKSVTEIEAYALTETAWMDAKVKKNPLVTVNGILLHAEDGAETVTVPEGVTAIAEGTFCDNSTMTAVILPESLRRICEDAFWCSAALREVTVPAGVTEIGNGAFYNCTALEKLTVLNPNCAIFDSDLTVFNDYDDSWEPYYSGVIAGWEGSTAQAYAKSRGITFESLGTLGPVRGDCDGDGRLSVADAVLLLRFITEALPQEECPAASVLADCDLNGDSVLSLADVRILLGSLAGEEPQEPAVTTDVPEPGTTAPASETVPPESTGAQSDPVTDTLPQTETQTETVTTQTEPPAGTDEPPATGTVKADYRIRAAEWADVTWTKYESAYFTLEIPEGWKVEWTGNAEALMWQAYSDKDRMIGLSNTDHLSLPKSPQIAQLLGAGMYLEYGTVEELFQKNFANSTDYFNVQNYCVPANKDQLQSLRRDKAIWDYKSLYATFAENGREGEGIYSAVIMEAPDLILAGGYNYAMWEINGIFTEFAPLGELVNWQPVLSHIAQSFTYTDYYWQELMARIGSSVSPLSTSSDTDSVVEAFEERMTEDTIIQEKRSDMIGEYERVYDTENEKIYRAYDGFLDDIGTEQQKYIPITDSQYADGFVGWIEK